MMENDFRQIHIRLSKKIYKELRIKCIYEDTSIQEYVTRLITDNMGEYSHKDLDLAISD
jgi:hypothetical protein